MSKITRHSACIVHRSSCAYCFADGNKRVGMLAVDVFLQINGHELIAPEPEPFIMMTRLASGETDENELAEWIRVNLSPLLD